MVSQVADCYAHDVHDKLAVVKEDWGVAEAVVVAMKAVRAAHGCIDRFVRELEAAIETSKKNENSAGCKIETDLDAMKGTLAAKDKELLAFEKKCVSSNGAGISSKEIQAAAELSKEIDDAIKNGRKKVAALRSLWKL